MRNILVIAAFLVISGLFSGCNPANQQPAANTGSYANNANTVLADGMPFDETDPFIKDNFDLQRAGELLRRSNSPAEFEAYLNEDDGINNLDLNGDGYADYISVEEFEDRGDGQRGLSLFARYGPDLVQNIASIFLYRDEPRYPGARVLLRGDEVLYGDNYYYETNWLDNALGIANLLFGNHDRYESPYYYDHYPSDYVAYEVVETQIYRTRIEKLYPAPVFLYAAAPPVYFERIKIKSPNSGLHLGQIYGRPMKPTKAQIDFRRGNPGKPLHARKDKGDDRPGRSGEAPGKQIKEDRQADKPGGPPSKVERKADPGKPDNAGKGGPPDKGKDKGPGKGQDQGKGQGKGKGKP